MKGRTGGAGLGRRCQRFGARVVGAAAPSAVPCASSSYSLLAVAAAVMQFLGVVQMLVRLHVDAEVAFGCRRVVADFAAVGFVAASVSLAAGQPWVRLAS